MARHTILFRLTTLLWVGLLAGACGGRAGTSTPTTAPAAPAVAAPSPDAAPTALAASGATEPAAVPSGKTAEGYNYLGSPDAPVTLQDFSDFY
jgi:uncharacterized membrane protein YfcA